MTKDILMGAVDMLEWWQVKPWVMSAKETGFDGDIWLIVYRASDEFIQQAQAAGVNLYQVQHTPYLTPIQHVIQNSPTQSHNLRFYHGWELLTRLHVDNEDWFRSDIQPETRIPYVIMTDVRDVIFQRNPTEWINSFGFDNSIIAPSEGIDFENEPWNKDNMIRGYGQAFYDLEAKEYTAYNVGTIAGDIYQMQELFHVLYSMTEGRYYPSDQSTFNVLAHGSAFKMVMTPMDEGWAAQCGTTLDPTKSFLWPHCIEPRPSVVGGKVYNSKGELYTLVHQWDRVPELKTIINEKYK
jgi:hypothetical protein